jgi:RNA polymerase sigma-70 factor (ECF subfamily)
MGRASVSPEADAAMDRYAAGDDLAFETLYDLLAPRLCGFLTRQTRNPALAEDLVQQTLLQMHRARGTFIPGASVISWSFAIARRLLIDGSRKAAREGLDPSANDEAIFQLKDGLTADQVVEAKETAAKLTRTIAALPASQRDAFTLVKGEGLALAEAAEVLGTTVTAVKLRVFRANEALRAALLSGDAR